MFFLKKLIKKYKLNENSQSLTKVAQSDLNTSDCENIEKQYKLKYTNLELFDLVFGFWLESNEAADFVKENGSEYMRYYLTLNVNSDKLKDKYINVMASYICDEDGTPGDFEGYFITTESGMNIRINLDASLAIFPYVQNIYIDIYTQQKNKEENMQSEKIYLFNNADYRCDKKFNYINLREYIECIEIVDYIVDVLDYTVCEIKKYKESQINKKKEEELKEKEGRRKESQLAVNIIKTSLENL